MTKYCELACYAYYKEGDKRKVPVHVCKQGAALCWKWSPLYKTRDAKRFQLVRTPMGVTSNAVHGFGQWNFQKRVTNAVTEFLA